MSFFASCAGLQIVAGSLLVPRIGAWTADLHLAGDVAITGPVVVIIGNLTLHGFVYRADAYGGQVKARLIGGYGGWRKQIAPQGYGNSLGVQLSTVLNDAASQAGEQIAIAADLVIGNAFARVNFGESVASDLLWMMLGHGLITSWYVGPDGITQTKPWPTTIVRTPFTVTGQKPDEGTIEIATEDYASWMPGCTFTDPLLSTTYTSAGVHYVFDNNGKFRFEVLTQSGDQDRVLGPIQQVIQKEIAPHRFFGRYEYTLTQPTSSTVEGSPTDTALGLPEIQLISLRSDSISSYVPPSGAKCEVMFTNGLPTRPVVVWTDQTPTSVVIGGSTAQVLVMKSDLDALIAALSTFAGGTVSSFGTVLSTSAAFITALSTTAKPIYTKILEGA